ncbi:MAG: xanthine dehydrogenase family protein molybdopterin-binding subunit [Syntrophorhabdaceae bacterium]|nr:xanthine dehydrogenase family protein molybdopterin-binding subunit [Syntrophorhabdaceae bacterium]
MPIKRYMDRIDAIEKVLGQAKYAGDIHIEGMLYGVIVRSSIPHGWIKNIDFDKALTYKGVIKILTQKDIPGENVYGIIKKDQPLLAKERVRYIGEPVAIVLGEDESIARRASHLIRIEYEKMDVVSDPLQSMNGGVKLHDDGNLLSHRKVIKGDIDRGFRESDVIVERTYRTTWLDHAYIEPEAGLGYMDEKGRLIITSSTQNVHYKRNEISRLLAIPEERIRIIQATTGGGFGGKLDMTVEGYVALSVYHTKRPVLIRFTREESFLSNTKRHPLLIHYKTGAKKDGTIQAVKVDVTGDTGAYASYGSTVCLRVAVHATGPYEVPNVYAESRMLYTNNPVSGAMRGFGVPQIAFAHESQMDIMAKELNIDPLEIRIKNALKRGSKTATSQELGTSVGFIETLKAIEPFWKGRKKSGTRGFGLGSMFYGMGNTGISNPSSARITLTEEGKIALHTGACDIGQGSDTVLLQILCETLDVDGKDVLLVRADTDLTGDAGSTSASRQTYISGKAVQLAALNLRAYLEKEGFYRGRGISEIYRSYRDRGFPPFEGYFDPPTEALDMDTAKGKPYATYAYATHMAEVEVDRITGYVKVLRVYAAHDVGKAINIKNIKGQVYGGIAMGIGFALMEEFIPGKTESLDNYYIPTSMDMPAMEAFIVEDEEPTGPFGAKGVGEPALIPQAAAIANAITDAVGVRPYELPCDLERLKKLL